MISNILLLSLGLDYIHHYIQDVDRGELVLLSGHIVSETYVIVANAISRSLQITNHVLIGL